MNPIIHELINIPKYGNGVGLHRMQYLCKEVSASDWWQQVRVINVVGSNGKGSVSNLLSSMLHECSLGSTGRYTSPHLITFNERIVVNQETITDEDLIRLIHAYREQEQAYQSRYTGDTIGAFEAFTAIALAYFHQQKVEHLILEAGIGGRYDSTRILGGEVVALTSLDLEHTNLLGKTLEDIGYDKVDIARENARIIVGDIPQEVLRKVRAYAALKTAEVISIREAVQLHECQIVDQHTLLDFEVAGLRFDNLRTSLVGEHQVNNILISVLTLLAYRDRYKLPISDARFIDAVRTALAKVSLLGRIQKVRSAPDLYIDLGHTPDAIKYLIETIPQLVQQRLILVTGVSYDKNAEEMVPQLERIADHVICTQAYHKGGAPDHIYNLVSQNKSKEIVAPIDKAVDEAIRQAQQEEATILVAGGLFLSIEALCHLQGKNPTALHFF